MTDKPKDDTDSTAPDDGVRAELDDAATGPDAENLADTPASDQPHEPEASERLDEAADAAAGPTPETEALAADGTDPVEEHVADGVQDETPEPAPVKTRGRGVAWAAFVFALLGVGGVGYLYYELIYLEPLAAFQAQSSAQQQRSAELRAGLEQELAELRDAQTAELQAMGNAQTERMAATESALRKSLQTALEAAPPSQREWKLAEAEYLLRIANHRVLMEQDSTGALQLLLATDQIIEELDDFALHAIRARLADEILALRQVPRDDLQGVYLRLEALKSRLDTVAFYQPRFEPTVEEAAPEAPLLTQLGTALAGFVRIRTLGNDETFKPLLAPQEEQYLELNLRLALEQAQLAALKRDQTVYEHAIASARGWMARYLDGEADANGPLLAELDALIQLELARPLPDISGSLTELLAVRRGAP